MASRFGPGVMPLADDRPSIGETIRSALQLYTDEVERRRAEEAELLAAGGEVVAEPGRWGRTRPVGPSGTPAPPELDRTGTQRGPQAAATTSSIGPLGMIRQPGGRPSYPRPAVGVGMDPYPRPAVGVGMDPYPRPAVGVGLEPYPRPAVGVGMDPGGLGPVGAVSAPPARPVPPRSVLPKSVEQQLYEGTVSDIDDPSVLAAIRRYSDRAVEGLGPEAYEHKARSGKVYRVPRAGVQQARVAAREAERARLTGVAATGRAGRSKAEEAAEERAARAEEAALDRAARAGEAGDRRRFDAEQAAIERQAEIDLTGLRHKLQKDLVNLRAGGEDGVNPADALRTISGLRQIYMAQLSASREEIRSLPDPTDRLQMGHITGARKAQAAGKATEDQRRLLEQVARREAVQQNIQQLTSELDRLNLHAQQYLPGFEESAAARTSDAPPPEGGSGTTMTASEVARRIPMSFTEHDVRRVLAAQGVPDTVIAAVLRRRAQPEQR